MRGSLRARALIALLSLSAVTIPAAGETLYVSNRLEIGVHESKEIDSVIVAVIPSGTPLVVTGRDGEFVQVTTPDGIKGWVDRRYVVSEAPAIAVPAIEAPADHDAKLEEAVRSLGAARAEVEVLRQRLKELERDAASAAANAKAAPRTSNRDSAMLKDAKRELDKLARENRQLKSDIQSLKAVQIAAEKSVAEPESEPAEKESSTLSIWQGPVAEEAKTWTPWQWLLAGSILLLAFAAGGYAVDWQFRRRHGGFRI